ncbi:MAG TPA: hypothetical protein VLB68_26690 [Pyrinomonadaceae bacterium]|nr:hypothetical protein [Pyrinomonadaceae bacterium]
MSIEVRKVIRIVKRGRLKGVTPDCPEEPQTEAQVNREIARVVVSWINDRKATRRPSIEKLGVVGSG